MIVPGNERRDENDDERHTQIAAIVSVLCGVLIMLSSQAHAIELTGAWSTDNRTCNQVFTRKGKQVVFSELSELYGSGLIIDGNRIKAKSAQCTIKSRKQGGNDLEMSAACSTSIMSGSLRFSLKVIDDNNFARIFPGTDGIELRHTRCTL